MRIYVGTLKTFEQEFEDCKKAIENQTYKDFQHFVFENLPNKEAHYTLFSDFLSKRHEFDILVKVDADTVLVHNKVFETIIEAFRKNPDKKYIQFPLYDFFTMKKIRGLNTYRNNIELAKQDNLFVDRFIKLRMDETLFVDKIVGYHSPNPSDYQAFHFGIHRQLKGQLKQVILPLLKAYFKTFDRKRALALIGAKLTLKGLFSAEDMKNYNNPKINEALQDYVQKSDFQLFMSIVPFFGFYPVKRFFIKIFKRN